MSNTRNEHNIAEEQYITMEVPATPAILAAAQGLPNLSTFMEVVNRTTHTTSSEGTSTGDDDMPRLATSSEGSDDDDEEAVPPARGTPRSVRLADTPSSRPGAGVHLMSDDTPHNAAASEEPLHRLPSHGGAQRGGPTEAARTRPRRRADDADSDAESVGSMPSLQTVSDSSEMDWVDESDSEEEESDDEDDAPPRQRNATITPGARPPALSEEWYEDDSDEEDNPLSIQDALEFGIAGLAAQGDYAQAYPSAARVDISEAVRFFMSELDLVASTPHPHVAEKDERRARTIMDALESVPEELVHRYEKVRAGVDEESCEGCAICRDDFISDASDLSAETETLALLAALPEYLPPAKIVAFPCKGMHLFHAECIEPWLARKTTCPTCRFDVDPESLTLTFLRDIRARSGDPLANKSWRPPKCKPFEQWLDKEERKLRGETDPSEDLTDNESDDSEDLPPLLRTTAELSPHNPASLGSSPLSFTAAMQSSMLAALGPLQAGPLHGDSDDLYSADFPRPSAPILPRPYAQFSAVRRRAQTPDEDEVEDGYYDDLPPLIPAEDGPSRVMPYASATDGIVEEINEDDGDDEDEEWEDDEDEEEYSDEDDEDLPPLIGEGSAPAPPASRHAQFHAIHMPTIEETMMAFAEVLEESLAAAEFDDLITHAVSQPPPPRSRDQNRDQQQRGPPPPSVDDID